MAAAKSKKYVMNDQPDVKVEVEQVKKDTTVDSPYGPILVTKGNFIMTNADGSKVGITQVDLERFYKLDK